MSNRNVLKLFEDKDEINKFLTKEELNREKQEEETFEVLRWKFLFSTIKIGILQGIVLLLGIFVGIIMKMQTEENIPDLFRLYMRSDSEYSNLSQSEFFWCIMLVCGFVIFFSSIPVIMIKLNIIIYKRAKHTLEKHMFAFWLLSFPFLALTISQYYLFLAFIFFIKFWINNPLLLYFFSETIIPIAFQIINILYTFSGLLLLPIGTSFKSALINWEISEQKQLLELIRITFGFFFFLSYIGLITVYGINIALFFQNELGVTSL